MFDKINMQNQDKKENSGISVWILVLLCMAQIGTSSDNSLLTISTKELVMDLQASIHSIQLTATMMPLVASSFMMLGGMLGVRYGYQRTFRGGLFFCFIGELITAFAPNILFITWFSRIVMGLGASLLIPSILGVVPYFYQVKQRAVAYGSVAAAAGLAIFIAPITFGLLMDLFGWRLCFFLIAAYFLIAFVMSLFIFPKVPKNNTYEFDISGTMAVAFGLFCLVLSLTHVSKWGLIHAKEVSVFFSQILKFGVLSPFMPVFILGLILLILFLKLERKKEDLGQSCILPSSFMEVKQVRSGLVLTGSVFLFIGSLFFLVVNHLQLVAGYSSLQSGFIMAVLAIPYMVASFFIPKFLQMWSSKSVVRTGLSSIILGCFLIIMGIRNTGLNIFFLGGLFIFGLGLGFIASQASFVIAEAVDQQMALKSGGIQATSRNIGQAIGVALVGMALLTTLTFQVNQGIIRNETLSMSIKEQLQSSLDIRYVSDEKFITQLNDLAINLHDKEKVLDIYQRAREKSTQISIGIIALVGGLCLLTTKNLPVINKSST